MVVTTLSQSNLLEAELNAVLGLMLRLLGHESQA